MLTRLAHQAAKLLSSLPEFYNPKFKEVSLAPQHAQCGQNLSQKNNVINLCNSSEPPVSSSTEGEPSAAAIQTPEFNHSQTEPS